LLAASEHFEFLDQQFSFFNLLKDTFNTWASGASPKFFVDFCVNLSCLYTAGENFKFLAVFGLTIDHFF